MAIKKQHATIQFQGAATINIGGTAGNNHYLKTASNGLLQWASGLTKKSYDIVWGNAGYSSAGVSWVSGDDAEVVTITHSLGTYDVIVSVRDLNSAVTENDNEQIDINYTNACVVKVHSTQIIKLRFYSEPADNKQFGVTIIG
jgi:hypothetical protein